MIISFKSLIIKKITFKTTFDFDSLPNVINWNFFGFAFREFETI